MRKKEKKIKEPKISLVKTLALSIREYKKASILAPIFVIIEVVLEVLIPFIVKYLVDFGINAKDADGNIVGNMNIILQYGGLLVLAALVALVFGALSGRCAAIAAAGFASNVRKDMYYNVQNFSFENIDRFSTASLINRMTKDVVEIQNVYAMLIRIAFRAPAMLIFAMCMSFTINNVIPLIFFAVIPVLAVVLFFLMRFAHPVFKKMFKHFDDLNVVVEEDLLGMRVVKSYVREDHEINKFNNISGNIFKLGSKAMKLMAFTNPIMTFCIYAVMLFICGYSANLIVKSGGTQMTTGDLTGLFTYVMMIMMNLMMLSMIIVMITISRPAAERITEVLLEKPTIVDPENPITQITDGSIEFKNVSFRYSERAERFALEDATLSIKAGETVGILGSTGSSKTTLVQLIPRLYDASEGEVLVGGHDVREYSIKELRDNVAMVLQKNTLFSGSIAENLRWGNENATDEEIKHACHLAQADSFIEAFPDKYDTHIEQGGTNVSGGQKQRLCIARALLKNPKILILDDSTSAVDTKTDALIRRGFKEFIPGTTKIIIAQRISSIEDADKIIIMDDGKINAVGTHEELLKTNTIYQEVYYSQVKGGENDE